MIHPAIPWKKKTEAMAMNIPFSAIAGILDRNIVAGIYRAKNANKLMIMGVFVSPAPLKVFAVMMPTPIKR